jgi:phosphatidylserine/phosphatidylglycerophosphate/cardiolipin synthase-like enzyme
VIPRVILCSALAACFVCDACATTYSLVTEPDQGLAPIYNLIRSAKRSIDVTMYELTDPKSEQFLAQAAASGVAVRVILDQHLEKSRNTPAYDYLDSHGVEVHWASPKYAATHQKTITVDRAVAAIMTLNLTSQYYRTDRDFIVLDNDPIDIEAIEETFEADFTNSPVNPPPGSSLVWSPTNSQSVILGLIGSTMRSLLIENEEMGDSRVVKALAAAGRRGVLVQVVMTNSADEYAAEFDELTAAGVQVSTYASNANPYIHAKVILADSGKPGAQAFLGSENFSNASLTRNRELGLILSDPASLQSLKRTLTNDFLHAKPWRDKPVPDPSEE